MAADDVQLKFRVPFELRAQLDEAAAASHRSVSAEITARLEDSFRANQAADIKVDTAASLLTAILSRVASDMQARGAPPAEFVAWMDQFPPFAQFLREAGIVADRHDRD